MQLGRQGESSKKAVELEAERLLLLQEEVLVVEELLLGLKSERLQRVVRLGS